MKTKRLSKSTNTVQIPLKKKGFQSLEALGRKALIFFFFYLNIYILPLLACSASTASLAFSSYSTFFGFQEAAHLLTLLKAQKWCNFDLRFVMQVTASESNKNLSGCSSDISCGWRGWGGKQEVGRELKVGRKVGLYNYQLCLCKF